MNPDIEAIRLELLQLQAAHISGNLDAAQYKERHTLLERRLVDLVLQDAPTPEPLGWLKYALLGLVVVLAVGCFWWLNNTVPRAPATDAANLNPHSIGNPGTHAGDAQQMGAMADRLAARLREQPDNAEGWAMLARTYGVLGRHAESLQAYENAVALRKGDADLQADYAKARERAGLPASTDKTPPAPARNAPGGSVSGTAKP